MSTPVHRDDRCIAFWSVDDRMSDDLGTGKSFTIRGRDPVNQFLL